jgi:predicted  nucleic acid-binding Zn-ribbon protein
LDNEIKDILVKLLEGQTKLETELNGIEDSVSGLETTVRKMDLRLEAMDKKIDLSLEGQVTNAEQINNIENEVTKHDEIIMRRVK